MEKRLPILGINDVIVDYDWFECDAIVATFDGVSFYNFRLIKSDWIETHKPRSVRRMKNELYLQAQNFGRMHPSIVDEAHATVTNVANDGHNYWANRQRVSAA
jgi:hypothetical protein